jgi:hypothetical protein
MSLTRDSVRAGAIRVTVPAAAILAAALLKLTTNEAAPHLKRHWRADIAAYDRVRAEILMMADTLAAGIIQQFPSRFT